MPDPVLAEKVAGSVLIQKRPTDIITADDVTNLYTLDLSGSYGNGAQLITDLTGIDTFSQLYLLDLNHNNLYNAGIRNVDWSRFTRMHTLWLEENHISDFRGTSIANIPNLTDLGAYREEIQLPDLPGPDPNHPITLGPAYNDRSEYMKPCTLAPGENILGCNQVPKPAGGTYDQWSGTYSWPDAQIGEHEFNWGYKRLIAFNDMWFTLAGTFSQKVHGVAVVFDPAGGTMTGQTRYDLWLDSKAPQPSDPTRNDYTFAGWYGPNGQKWNFNTILDSSYDMQTITLTARWNPIPKYTVTIDPQNGDSTSSQTITSGGKVTQPATPTKSHSRFDGWYTAASGGSKWNFNTGVTSNMTLYGHWTGPSTVTFDPQNGTGTTSTIVDPDQAVSPPSPPSKGDSRFDGWYTAATGGTKWNFSDVVAGDMTLYAHWTDKYDVIFDATGGTNVPSRQRIFSGDHATQPGTDPRKVHARFDGWYTAAAGGTRWNFTTDTISNNITLYAHWTTYTVSFDPQNGQTIPDQLAAPGETVNPPSNPTKSDSRFEGWYTSINGGDRWNFTTDTISNNITLYAHWTDKYTVTFKSQGSVIGSQRVFSGQAATQPTDPSVTGWIFQGWYTSESGGYQWNFSSTVTSDITLYARWFVRYPVTFDPNGGTLTSPSLVYVGAGYTVSKPSDPVKDHARFDGWYTAATGGTAWNFISVISGPVTIYAHWTTYTVTFDPQNGHGVTMVTVKPDTPVREPTPPTSPGKAFAGWYTAPTGGDKWDFTTPVRSSGINLYGHWDDFKILPKAGELPAGRYSGGMMLASSTLAGLVYLSYQSAKAKCRHQAPSHRTQSDR
ncbi:hypothetical protein KIM372_00720 [Bombiscardovia nodaiensis]|uniref:Internalin-A n=1 Tax=Bombiscardovia nodaiensis TaxID=2932181 RepID=A0ABN6SB82_9BIFI|nr:hypothetical protein KIM372_00720 [Bombiscardovia nodaiensis]